MSKLILTVDDEDLNLFKKQYLNLVDLYEEIEKLFEEEKNIDKRKKKAYKEWKDKINFLIDLYNTKSTYKTYNKVK
jgi:hypothetical protein